MNKDKIITLIDKLASETKEGKFNWSRLLNIKENSESNKMIDYYINDVAENEDAYVDNVDSYYVEYKGGFVLIFYIKDPHIDVGHYIIALQKESTAKVVPLNKKDKYKSELMRLQYLIEDYLNNTDDYLDSILED